MKRSASKQPQYKILTIDPWLKPYYSDIALRMQRHADTRRALLGDKADLSSFANGYLYYGIARTEDGWVYREWAPGADEMHLIGDFNDWDRESHPLTRLENGNWEIKLDGEDALMHGQRIKVQVTKNGEKFDRIPAYIRRVVRDPETNEFYGQVWAPNRPFRWTDGGYGKRKLSPLFIYTLDRVLAQEDESVGTYREFADRILDRVQEAGTTPSAHSGHHGASLLRLLWLSGDEFLRRPPRGTATPRTSSTSSTPRRDGMFVLLDVVHSHASKNTNEGLNRFDGTDDQYFIAQDHPAWDTKLFNYGKYEVIHFLLSNLKFWLQDTTSSASARRRDLHALPRPRAGHGLHELRPLLHASTPMSRPLLSAAGQRADPRGHPFAVTIAEDMSGMPGMCLPIRYGGIGFDYRLSMGVPDFWIKTLKESDENWDMRKMWHELTSRRPQEKNIGYSESHDQALVGDKTLIFRMADAEMYTGMNKDYHSITMDRAIALHKMIRFITLVLAGEGYLNFMGNGVRPPRVDRLPPARATAGATSTPAASGRCATTRCSSTPGCATLTAPCSNLPASTACSPSAGR